MVLTLSSRMRVRELHQLMSPWLIRPDMYLAIIEEMFAALSNPEQSVAGAKRDGNKGYVVHGRTAVVDIVGPILKRPGFISELFSLPTYKEIQKTASALASDGSVDTVVFNIDSPGGVSSGCIETVESIRNLSKSKKTIALIDGMGTSAAYWLASACDKVYATPSSEVGSVGAIMFRPEYANPDEHGNSVAVFASGEQKKDFVGYVKINDEMNGRLQEYIDNIGTTFVDNVVQLRGLNDEAAKMIAHAGVFSAEDAVKIGLIDGINNFVNIDDARDVASNENGGEAVMETVSENSVEREALNVTGNEPQSLGAVPVQETFEQEATPVAHTASAVSYDEVESLKREVYELKVVQPYMNDVRSVGFSDDAELSAFEKLVRLDAGIASEVLAIFKKRLAIVTSKVKISVENKSDNVVIKLPIPGMNKEVDNV